MKSTQLHIRKISFLTSSLLLLAALEMLIPKPLPFFKLGLSNIILLLSLEILSKKEYAILVLIKVFITSFLSGTLFSFIFLISFSSTLLSSITCFVLYYSLVKKNIISFISLSVISSFVYNVSLLYTSSYLLFTSSIFYLAFPLLIFGTISSLIIGIIIERYKVKGNFISLAKENDPVVYTKINKVKTNSYPLLSLFLLVLLYFSNLQQLFILAIILTIFTTLLKIKIKVKITLITTLTIILSQLVLKRGLVLYENSLITITKNSLETGVYLSLYLYNLIRIGNLVSKSKLNIKNKNIAYFITYFNYYKNALYLKKEKNISLLKQIDSLFINAYTKENYNNNFKNIENNKNYLYVLLLLSSYVSILIYYLYHLM